MSNAIVCDAPGCDTWTTGLRAGWLVINSYDMSTESLHFCCPWHVAQWAAQYAPPEVIE
jgi:aspartate/methionine/tyrosine aminotransferase